MMFWFKLRTLIQKYDVLPKLLCILLAVILWANVQNNQIEEISYHLTPEIVNLPSELVVFEDLPRIKITLKGKKEYIKSVNISHLKLYVDMSKPVIGYTHPYPLKLSHNDILHNSIELHIEKEKCELTVYKLKQKVANVKPLVVGTVAENHVAGIVSVRPEYVKMIGPDIIVDSLKDVFTRPLNIEGKNTTTVFDVVLEYNRYPKVKFSPSIVHVVVPIVHVNDLIQLKVPIEIRNRKANYHYILKDKYVTIFLKREIINSDNIADTMFTAYINGDLIGDVNTKDIVPIIIEKRARTSTEIFGYEPKNTEVIVHNIEH